MFRYIFTLARSISLCQGWYTWRHNQVLECLSASSMCLISSLDEQTIVIKKSIQNISRTACLGYQSYCTGENWRSITRVKLCVNHLMLYWAALMNKVKEAFTLKAISKKSFYHTILELSLLRFLLLFPLMFQQFVGNFFLVFLKILGWFGNHCCMWYLAVQINYN